MDLQLPRHLTTEKPLKNNKMESQGTQLVKSVERFSLKDEMFKIYPAKISDYFPLHVSYL